MRAQKASVPGLFEMAATVLCGVLRVWRTGVPLGCGLRRLVRALSLVLEAEGWL